jgi:hypothetical protein
MAQVPEVMARYESHFSRHDMTLEAFLQVAQRDPLHESVSCGGGGGAEGALGPGDFRVAFACPLGDWPELARDIDVAAFIPRPRDYDHTHKLFQEPYIWITEARATTPMHYDVYHNSYIQLRGEKTFFLSPPESHDRLYLRPALHPAHRSSQLGDVVKHFAAAGAAAGAGDPALLLPPPLFKVTLRPGDVLFIPALWFHQVQAETFSLSINVWTEYHGAASVTDELNHLALPISDTWERAQQIQVYRVYILLALANARVQLKGMDGASAGAADAQTQLLARLKDLLIAQRYRDIGMANTTMPVLVPHFEDELGAPASTADHNGPERFCGDSAILGQALSFGGYELLVLQDSIQKAVRLLQALQEQTTMARLEIYIANWVEHVVCNAVGVRLVHQFLVDLTGC